VATTTRVHQDTIVRLVEFMPDIFHKQRSDSNQVPIIQQRLARDFCVSSASGRVPIYLSQARSDNSEK
jgi:hypothetical protein